MQDLSQVSSARQQRALWLSTFAFTTCFAVWMIFSIIGIQIKKDLAVGTRQIRLKIASTLLSVTSSDTISASAPAVVSDLVLEEKSVR